MLCMAAHAVAAATGAASAAGEASAVIRDDKAAAEALCQVACSLTAFQGFQRGSCSRSPAVQAPLPWVTAIAGSVVKAK